MTRSKIALLISAALSLTANANSPFSHYHDDKGITHIDKQELVPLLLHTNSTNQIQNLVRSKGIKKSLSTKSSANQIVPQTCEPSEFASYSGNDFVEYVSNAYLYNEVQAGYECFRPIAVKFEQDTTVFSEDNINNVADAIVSELSSDDYIPERIFGKLFFLRLMYYNHMVQGGAHAIPSDESKIKAAFDAIMANYDGSNIDETHQITIAELFIALGSYYSHFAFMEVDDGGERIAQWSSIVPEMKSRLSIIQDKFTAPDEENQYGLYRAANEIIAEFNRMTRYYIGNETYNDAEMPNILAQYIYNINVDDPVPSNAIYALLAMAEVGITDEIVEAIQSVIDNTGKFSQPHVALLNSISSANIDCSVFKRDALLCITDDLIAEMREYALPNTFQFGDITFITKMTEQRTRHIYNTLQATRSRFFRETGITEPVENDPNENVTFVLYGSPEDYGTFQGLLHGLDSNNGGIYIEQDGTLYSFDRPDTEMFVLEELARHEYVHYLNGRYLTQGMWGETEFFENDRYTWFDEGFANYLTGATQYDSPTPLATMVDMKGWYNEKSISEIVNATYSDDWMYPYTALLFNYLNQIGSDAIVELAAAIRSNDSTLLETTEQSLTAMESGFQAYISDLTADGWVTPWYEYKVDALLEANNTNEIQSVLTTAMNNTVTCTEVDEANFSCSFSIEASGNKFAQIETVNTMLDSGIKASLRDGENNFETMTCHPTVFNNENVIAECIGLLRPDNVEFDNGIIDSDSDGVADEEDAFPNDPTEWLDSDGDGVGDNTDAFPNDENETTDSDGDGYGDNSDAFSEDAGEWLDSDNDGVGDNADVFPNDETETTDTDGDGYGDNSDLFPEDASEWLDSDNDGVGDNSDAFPDDATETKDSDGDGYGDNSDAYPNDSTRWQQEANNNTETKADSGSSGGGSLGLVSSFLLLILSIFRRKVR